MKTECDLHWEMLDKEHDWDGYFGHFIRVQYGQLCMVEMSFCDVASCDWFGNVVFI